MSLILVPVVKKGESLVASAINHYTYFGHWPFELVRAFFYVSNSISKSKSSSISIFHLLILFDISQ